MSDASCKSVGPIRSSVKQWYQNRRQECVHCWQCGGAVTPWETHCPNCGQMDPVRISKSAVVYLVLAFVLLTAALSCLVWAF